MHPIVAAVLSIAGRLMLCAIFLLSAVMEKIPNFQHVVKVMGDEGVPMPNVLLIGAIVFLIGGSLSVITGYHARVGAGMLAVFLILATYFFHDFWNLEDADKKMEQMSEFMKNAGLFGAMVFLIANGPGAGSLDVCLAPAEPAAETPSA